MTACVGRRGHRTIRCCYLFPPHLLQISCNYFFVAGKTTFITQCKLIENMILVQLTSQEILVFLNTWAYNINKFMFWDLFFWSRQYFCKIAINVKGDLWPFIWSSSYDLNILLLLRDKRNDFIWRHDKKNKITGQDRYTSTKQAHSLAHVHILNNSSVD